MKNPHKPAPPYPTPSTPHHTQQPTNHPMKNPHKPALPHPTPSRPHHTQRLTPYTPIKWIVVTIFYQRKK